MILRSFSFSNQIGDDGNIRPNSYYLACLILEVGFGGPTGFSRAVPSSGNVLSGESTPRTKKRIPEMKMIKFGQIW